MGLQWCCDYRAAQVVTADHELLDRPSKRAAGPRRATLGTLGRQQRFARLPAATIPEDVENAAPVKPVVMEALVAPVLSDVTNTAGQRWITKVPRPGIAPSSTVPNATIAALAAAAASSVTGTLTGTGRGLPAAAVKAAAASAAQAASLRPPPVPQLAAAAARPMEVTSPGSPKVANPQSMVEEQDPQQVKEYLADINSALHNAEPHFMPEANYMDGQPHVNAKMRAILVDWLVDVHKKYKLRQETLFLAIGLIDRFLERRTTARRHLQLVGVAALLIAAKFEELYPPQVQDFVYITDKAYTKEEVIKMEVSILTALDFKVCQPTAVHFMERFHRVNGCTQAHRDLAQYLLELTLVEYRMVRYSASHLAAAALLLSNKLLRKQPSWDSRMCRKTGFMEQALRECAREICNLLERAESSPMQAVRKKFSQQKYSAVSKLNFAGDASPASAAAPGSISRPSAMVPMATDGGAVANEEETAGDMDVEDPNSGVPMDSAPV